MVRELISIFDFVASVKETALVLHVFSLRSEHMPTEICKSNKKNKTKSNI